MLRIGICDDIADARLLLQDALERVLEMGGWEAQFFQFSSGEGLVEWFAKHSGELDLVFLDMEMKALDGIETAKRLRAMDENLQLVFCTSYACSCSIVLSSILKSQVPMNARFLRHPRPSYSIPLQI